MDINKGIKHKNKYYYQHQNHIDEKQRYTFEERNHSAFAIKSMMCREKVIEHPDVAYTINDVVDRWCEGIINKESHNFPKKEEDERYQ